MNRCRTLLPLISGLVLILPFALHAAEYNVTNPADSLDPNTLRWAINQANANPGPDSIDILAGPLTVASPLPPITSQVFLDGNGVTLAASMMATCMALSPAASDCRIFGIAFVSGIVNHGIALSVQGSRHVVSNCRFGTNWQSAAGQGFYTGVSITGTENLIGGNTSAGQGNVMSGNNTGVYLAGCGNTLAGNVIGLAHDQSRLLPNITGVYGMGIGNAIGLPLAGWGNVIAGNSGNNGMDIIDAVRFTFQNNLIGIDAAGNTYTGFQSNSGLLFNRSVGCLVGGDGAAMRGNVISGNGAGIRIVASAGNSVCGNIIGLNATQNADRGNDCGIFLSDSFGNAIGLPVAGHGNVITGNTSYGIYAIHSSGNTICGNVVGLDASQTTAFPSTTYGIALGTLADGNTIGLPVGNGGNVVAGNFTGIYINGCFRNLVRNNLVGVNSSGIAKPNTDFGIQLTWSEANQIGGDRLASEGNVISGNGQTGLALQQSRGNRVFGNIIGLSPLQTAYRANGVRGLVIEGNSDANQIGSSTSGYGNVISGNDGTAGVYLTQSRGNTLAGNVIGLNSAQNVSWGNSNQGVALDNAHGNWIGLDEAGGGNVISGNNTQGISLVNANDNRVHNNCLGVNAAGQAFPNNSGIYLQSSSGNLIGGNGQAYQGNVISGNGYRGVNLTSSPGNSICGNVFGLSPDQTQSRPNTDSAIVLSSSHANVVGAGLPGWGNVVCGSGNGIYISMSSHVSIKQNRVGLSDLGQVHPNTVGINLELARQCRVGGVFGPGRYDANVITGNTNRGLWMWHGSGNTVTANMFNVSAAGNSLLASYTEVAAVMIDGGTGHLIGGINTDPNAYLGNLVTGHNRGIEIRGGATGNSGVGNAIGYFLDLTPAPESFANAVWVVDAPGNRIGVPDWGNMIAGGANGVVVENAGSFGNGIYSNLIQGQSSEAISLRNAANANKQAPVISSAVGQAVAGPAQSSGDVIEVFQAEPRAGQGGSLNFLGRTTTGSDNRWSINVDSIGGQYVCATASDEDHSTSEFSNNLYNTGPTATPTATVTPTITVTPTVTTTAIVSLTPITTSTPTTTPTVELRLAEGEKVRAFPNPGRNRINFVLNLESDHHVTIDLYNSTGERIAAIAKDVSGPLPILTWDCSSVSCGVYIARLRVDGKEWGRMKLAVAR